MRRKTRGVRDGMHWNALQKKQRGIRLMQTKQRGMRLMQKQ